MAGVMSSGDDSGNLQTLAASWGLARVTSTVIGLVNRQTTPQSLSVAASNSVFGDGWPGVKKTLFVAYRYGETGAVGVATATEGNMLGIGAAQEGGQALAATSAPQLSVLAAAYGPQDVTAAVQAMVDQSTQSLSLTANNQTFGDTWPGVVKSFAIVAAYTGQVPFIDIVPEGSPYFLKYRPPLRILSAAWGLEDLTAKIQSSVSRRTLSIVASDGVLGDGWPGVVKSLAVVSQYGNQEPLLTIATEGTTLAVDYAEQPDYQPAPDASALNVIRAAYGQADVTSKVIDQLGGGDSLNFIANNALFGDSWPGTRKSFSVTYSWGPTSPQTFIAAENGEVDISQPPPTVPSGLVPMTGLVAPGDNIAIQSGPGSFLTTNQAGQIVASAASIAAAASFTVNAVPNQSDQLTLSTATGNVVVGNDGTLYVSPTGTPARLVLSLTTTGTLVLSVTGADLVFVGLRDDGAIVAAGSNTLTFTTTFGLMLNPTQQGLENHLAALGIELDALPQAPGDFELIKLVWDLTGGLFLAIGLGPLIGGSQQVQTGVFALIRSNPRTNAALNNLINLVKANPGTTVGIGTLLGFGVTVWDAGLMWKIIRLALNFGTWWAIGRAAVKILEITLLPELEAAELAVSFALWAYTTTTDALAYVNATGAPAGAELAQA